MADIAMLVAEEYERRIKNSKGNQELGQELNNYVSQVAVKIRAKIGEQRVETFKWVLEPKSQLGVAASNGFFSA